MTLEAITARTITFSVTDLHTKKVTEIRSFAAGTLVYATVRRNAIRIRIPGTLFTQDVYPNSIIVP